MSEVWSVVCATAHRRLPKAAAEWLPDELLRVAIKLRDEHGTVTGCSGMALGGDMLWADAVLAAGLKLWAHAPFPQQPDRWPAKHQDHWAKLYAAAHQETVYGEEYDVRLLHARNDGMLDAAKDGAVIAIWNPASDPRSGTRSCVSKALRREMPIVWVDPVELRTTRPGPERLRRLLQHGR